jgi:hypothetical protein
MNAQTRQRKLGDALTAVLREQQGGRKLSAPAAASDAR